ncbi:hypothetical protein F5888DRAFT_1858822 [Russula emetica]|nr:hypothetical protein F5888DRAFT_1858822 [Russula emetica]
MSLPSSRKKKHSKAPASGLASSQVAQQERQQSQPVGPWSAHVPPFGQSPSPFPRYDYALSTSTTAAGELFLFGGYVQSSWSLSSDLYVISTRDFSTTLLKTSGDVPSPRYGHSAVLSSTILLIWGGIMQNQALDDSLYLLNLVSREWTCILVNGPGPGGRYYHTMTLVGSKLFVFGGRTAKGRLNDIWALDLDCLNSKPFWESYEPAPGNEEPLPRNVHVSVTTGDRIIIFGGYDGQHVFNDTWSFNISTRKWTELQCTGSIPSPRGGHAAVLIDDVMYVFGGRAIDGTNLGGLTAFKLSTQRWTAFQDVGSSPSGRFGHAMACDGTRVFVLGGELSPGAQVEVDEAKLIHVLDTTFKFESELLIYPKLDSNTVKHSEKITQLAQKVSAGHPTQGQPQQPTFSLSDSDVHAEHGTSPFQKATPGEFDLASLHITRDRTPGPNDLPSLLPGMNDKPGRVPEEDNDSEGSTEHHAKLVAPDTSSEKGVARLEHQRLADLERQFLAMRAAQTERDRRIAQLTDQLVQKGALLEGAEANVAGAKRRAGLEQRELQVKLGELLLSYNEAEANAAEVKRHARLEVRELQAKLDESLLSRDHALEQAEANAAEERKRAGLEVRKLQAKLDESLRSRDHALEQAEANAAKEKKRAGLELREVQAKLDESLLSRDHALEQAQSALQKASCAAEASEQSQRELTEMRAELEASKSELAAFRLRLVDTENGCTNSKADGDTYRTQTATGLVNTDEDRVMHRLMERVQAMEEMASRRWNDKSFEMMECRNEG